MFDQLYWENRIHFQIILPAAQRNHTDNLDLGNAAKNIKILHAILLWLQNMDKWNLTKANKHYTNRTHYINENTKEKTSWDFWGKKNFQQYKLWNIWDF